MRKILQLHLGKVLLVAAMMMGMSSWGQTVIISEGFESGLPAGYSSTTTYTLGSGTWTGQANGVLKGTGGSSGIVGGTGSCQLRNQNGAQVTTPSITAGVSTVTFYGASSTASGSVQVNYSINGGTDWIPASGSPFSLTTGAGVLKTATINSTSPNILVQFLRTAATVYLDNVEIKSYTAPGPTTTVTGTLSAFASTNVGASSASQSFTVSGASLTNDVIVTAPADFEVSLDNVTFASSRTITASGTLSSTTVHVRFTPTSGGAKSGNVSVASTGATTKTVAVSGTGVGPTIIQRGH